MGVAQDGGDLLAQAAELVGARQRLGRGPQGVGDLGQEPVDRFAVVAVLGQPEAARLDLLGSQWGAIFSTNVMKVIPLDPGTSSGEPTPGYDDQIRQAVNSTQLGNMTSTWLALDRARAMHDAVPGNEARHVLLVSDGQPHVNGNVPQGISKSQASAQGLWADQVTIWTLQIQNLPSNQTAAIQQLEAFMRSISGPPDAHPDGTYYRQGHSGTELADQFKKIAALIACEMGPLEPAPPDPNNVNIFLSAGLGDEEALDDARKQGATTVSNLSDPDLPYANGRFFFYKAETGMLYVTESVCKDIIDGGRGVVIRFQPPKLYE